MKNIFYLIILALLFVSCGRRDRNYILEGKLKETSNIDIGSIFVFQDSITNDIDTCIVNLREDRAYPIDYYSKDIYTAEQREVALKSKPHINDNNHFFIRYSASSKSKNLSISFYEKAQNKPWSARVYSEPFLSFSEIKNKSTTNNISTERLNNTIVKGINYPAVFENTVEIIDSNQISTNTCTTYYTLNETLIKIRVKTDTSFIVKELIYSKIIRK